MNGNTPPGAPKVFISSTVKDLEEYRAKAEKAAAAAGFLAVMCEDWEAKDKLPIEECLEQVDQTRLTLVIVAHRYGWVPKDQDGCRSITWLECGQTKSNGNDLLVFMPEESMTWPDTKKEAYRVFQAVTEGKPAEEIAGLATEVQRNTEELAKFKTWLTAEKRIRNAFTTPEDFQLKAERSLRAWLDKHPEFKPQASAQAKTQADPETYLRQLRESCAYIDIRGLQTGSGKAHRFPIEQLYIELDTSGGGKLKDTLAHPRRVIVGDPGCGKTTFLRWIANRLTNQWLEATERPEGFGRGGLPVFISIAEWLEHIRTAQTQNLPGHPRTGKDPGWLPHYLADQAQSHEWGLSADWFRECLRQGHCLLLFDGLDEAPDRKTREFATQLLEAVSATWGQTPIVVTSRPSGYQDRSVLAGFEPSHIEPLSDRAVETFLDRWSAALHPTDSGAASAHRRELLLALNARPTIRRLARNTVMLTALAVVHWNEKRLPEQRAELYESIVLWLARSREQRPGRAGPERSLEVLRALALAMQTHEKGRQVQVTRHWAAEQVAGLFQGHIAQAEAFLEEEELDSGIIVRRGNELRFWHLSFQEYLAARAIGGLSEEKQKEILLGGKRVLFEPEWREVGQLLGGVLYEQGRDKVDGLVRAVLDDLYRVEQPPLVDQSRVAGLLGGIVRDLAPFQYDPADTHYREVLEAALGIFDKDKAGAVPVAIRIEAAEALGQAGDPRLADESQYWVEIKGGYFWMGAQKTDPAARNYDPEAYEAPPHQVEVAGFRIGRWPVTVQEYLDFMDDEAYGDERWWRLGGFRQWQGPKDWEDQNGHPNRPVVGVSWFESMAYCAWLTEHLASTGQLEPGRCVRLPTEAEWEWAARGESVRHYPWGSEGCSPDRLNYDRNVGNPTPVGVYPEGATPEGVLDLAGNVWEWCSDWFAGDYYQVCAGQGRMFNPTGPEQGKSRVLRGGSWDNDPDFARSSYRGYVGPGLRRYFVGFRLVCSPPITVL